MHKATAAGHHIHQIPDEDILKGNSDTVLSQPESDNHHWSNTTDCTSKCQAHCCSKSSRSLWSAMCGDTQSQKYWYHPVKILLGSFQLLYGLQIQLGRFYLYLVAHDAASSNCQGFLREIKLSVTLNTLRSISKCMLLYICFAIFKGQTCDLIHKSESSSAVCFILIFSDPDVELVRRMTTVIVVELQALDIAVSFRGHCLAFHFGCISLISALGAEVHEERRPCRQWNWCIVQNWMVQWLQLWLEVRHYFLGNKNLSVNKHTLSKKRNFTFTDWL